MQSSLEHLPPHKQREIERVVEIIFEEFEDALALATQDWKRKGRISKIILYGSYARGGWVDEPHTAKGYQSDYDLLIIVNDKRLTDRADYWSKLDDRLIRFDEWYSGATEFIDGYKFYLDRRSFKKAAFLLHQAVESYYHCVLLVGTLHTPHIHNLAFLRTQAERIDARLFEAWPREVKADRSRFEKLKEAYIKARYSKHYSISAEELEWLGARVERRAEIVDGICRDRIAELEATARRAG